VVLRPVVDLGHFCQGSGQVLPGRLDLIQAGPWFLVVPVVWIATHCH